MFFKYDFILFYLDWQIIATLLFWYKVKTRIWVGNCFVEKGICFGFGLELRKTYFELISEKGIFFFPVVFLGIGKQCIFSETHLLDCVFGLSYAVDDQKGTFFQDEVFILRAKKVLKKWWFLDGKVVPNYSVFWVFVILMVDGC